MSTALPLSRPDPVPGPEAERTTTIVRFDPGAPGVLQAVATGPAPEGFRAGTPVTKLSTMMTLAGRGMDTLLDHYFKANNVPAEKQASIRGMSAINQLADPKLPPGGLDRIFMVHMFHEVTDPYAFLWHLREGLKPDGLVVVVDANRPVERHGMPPA